MEKKVFLSSRLKKEGTSGVRDPIKCLEFKTKKRHRLEFKTKKRECLKLEIKKRNEKKEKS